MNVFADLARPIVDRPGSLSERDRERYRRLSVSDSELSPEELQQREARRRRPNADLPVVANEWGLTPVHCAVAALAAEGLENKEIGARLHISPKTVHVHMAEIRKRMGNVNRARVAVLWALFTIGRKEGQCQDPA